MSKMSELDAGSRRPERMDPGEFLQVAGQALDSIEQAMTSSEIDADTDFVSEGVLEITFSDGAKMVVNRHEVAQEVWVAGRTGAHHFFWSGSRWVDTRSHESLFLVISRLASVMAGKPINLSEA